MRPAEVQGREGKASQAEGRDAEQRDAEQSECVTDVWFGCIYGQWQGFEKEA